MVGANQCGIDVEWPSERQTETAVIINGVGVGFGGICLPDTKGHVFVVWIRERVVLDNP